ncbi:hypothetical protein [Cellulophaga sp. BC115SP]|uniref:hypothetical protein n=1 Tax=Cellulophaga sp. BC115SP TaxID=2683263 RepID=UPI0014121E46|nr:hypothetical protein [Cellulophaga sp. BC115SP]NBB29549.1 hypothetical protein [Cellulophaga sp. BC115SP]
MNTAHVITVNILQITMEIMEKYPELSEYLTEMPITVPNEESPLINSETLSDYLQSLEYLLKNYSFSHL